MSTVCNKVWNSLGTCSRAQNNFKLQDEQQLNYDEFLLRVKLPLKMQSCKSRGDELI